MTTGSDFSGRTVFITGATSGVGRALALACSSAGMELALTGRDRRALSAVAEQVEHISGRRPWSCGADLALDTEINALCDQLTRDIGGLDVVVHSAGCITRGSVEATPAAVLDAQYRTNLRAPYLITQRMLPLLRARRGQIVFINSTVIRRPAAGAAQYAATKQALRALADGLREEVNGDGVRVLSVFLGTTATEMQKRLHADADKEFRPERFIQPEDVASLLLEILGTRRSLEVTDLTLRPMLKPEA